MENKKEKPKKENLHKGHRARVRQKFIKEQSLDNFNDHEVLEFLLFYAYPMRDTNEMAHRLLMQYGTLHNLMNTKTNALINEGGLTENAATLLTALPHINRRYLKSEFNKSPLLTDSKKAGKFMMSLFNGQNYESLYLISLNLRKKIISVDEISRGDADSVSVNLKRILQKTLLNNAKFVIIGHNHPAGTLKPSVADVNIAKALLEEFKLFDIYMLDNMIVTSKGYYSFSEHKYFGLTYNPIMD